METTQTTKPAAIVEILSVTDTRSYEEIGDRWVPIDGSGTENECARCGRIHVVHAEVRLADGRIVIVGTGCMNAESTEIRDRLKSAASRAKRIAALRAECAKLARTVETNERAWAIANALTPPAVDVTEKLRVVGRDAGTPFACYRMGDASVMSMDAAPGTPIDSERYRTLVWFWRTNRAIEAGAERYSELTPGYLADARKRLAKLEAKVN